MTIHITQPPDRGYVYATQSYAPDAHVFDRAADYRAFLTRLNDAFLRDATPLVAYCVMPRGWALVAGPGDPSRVKRLIQGVARTHVPRPMAPATTARASVYQGLVRTRALINAPSLIDACRDIERQPLGAGLVRRAQDWPWSSLAERLFDLSYVHVASTPFLASRAWSDYVNTPRDEFARPLPMTPRPRPLRMSPRLVTTSRRPYTPSVHAAHTA